MIRDRSIQVSYREYRTKCEGAKRLKNRMREMWRTFARPVTLFDLCSPRIFFAIETREFFVKSQD